MRPIIPENDFQFLVSLGDTDLGYVARGDYAEMAGIPVEEVDLVILNRIYGV